MDKGLEETGAEAWVDTDAGVGDFDAQPGGGLGARIHARGNEDFTFLGELDGVADEVDEDLADASGIALQAGWERLDVGNELELF